MQITITVNEENGKILGYELSDQNNNLEIYCDEIDNEDNEKMAFSDFIKNSLNFFNDNKNV